MDAISRLKLLSSQMSFEPDTERRATGGRVASVLPWHCPPGQVCERIETTRCAAFHIRLEGHLGGEQFQAGDGVHAPILERMGYFVNRKVVFAQNHP